MKTMSALRTLAIFAFLGSISLGAIAQSAHYKIIEPTDTIFSQKQNMVILIPLSRQWEYHSAFKRGVCFSFETMNMRDSKSWVMRFDLV